MLAIIAHHYVVNSGVTGNFTYNGTTPQQYFLEAWGLWGKTAINSFILISGYFMCRMRLTWQRYAKLVVEVYFYSLLIYFILALCGHETITVRSLIEKLLAPVRHINNGFTASFLCFYAFVPFYNMLIDKCTQKQLQILIAGLLFVMTGCGLLAPTMNEPLWYMTVYLIAGHIRNYPVRMTESLKFAAVLLIVSVGAGIAINFASIYLANATGNMTIMHFRRVLLIDSNMPLSLVIGVASFLTFKNLPKFYSPAINFLAAGTFGVLLIHASSDAMRHLLWNDICNVPEMMKAPLHILIAQAVSVPVIVFLVCSVADYLRRTYIESPLFRYLNLKFTQKTEPIKI